MMFRLTSETESEPRDIVGHIRPDRDPGGRLETGRYLSEAGTMDTSIDIRGFEAAFDRIQRGLDDLQDEAQKIDELLAPLPFRAPEPDDDGPWAA